MKISILNREAIGEAVSICQMSADSVADRYLQIIKDKMYPGELQLLDLLFLDQILRQYLESDTQVGFHDRVELGLGLVRKYIYMDM